MSRSESAGLESRHDGSEEQCHRPTNCGCDYWNDGAPCWACVAAGFETPAYNDGDSSE